MSIFDVNNFVSHDAGELRRALDAAYEAREEINRTPGHRKGVELRIFDDKETIVERLWPHNRKQPLPHAADVSLDLQVIDEVEVLLGFTPEFPADSFLLIFLDGLHEWDFCRGIGTAAAESNNEERRTKRTRQTP
jgi:hypothetical protein